MDKHYADTARLLLHIAPEVFAGQIFAMKGGTAINLFVQSRWIGRAGSPASA